MKTKSYIANLITAIGCLLGVTSTTAVTNSFFTGSQTATLISSNANAVTIQSGDYQFTSTVDGLWAVCPGCTPTGRFFSVFWPTGVQAQAITAGPLTNSGANITIKRADGKRFDFWAFTGKLLANTGATGGAFEVMPQLNGEDALNDPLMFDCSGSAGQSFSHSPMLTGYDTYKIHLWVDWAVTALTLIDTNPPVTPVNVTITTSSQPIAGGTTSGGGTYTNGAGVTVTATANVGYVFVDWTEGGTSVSTSTSYNFTATADRTLVANFITNQPPLAFGSAFFQLTGQPLAINIADLMWSDYDPDGNPITFISVSATSSNGLALTTNATQILVPANSLADGFSYTIADSHGAMATGTAMISIINSPTSHVNALDLSAPGGVTASFIGVPWYSYTAERATNVSFTGTVAAWPVQAWADGSITIWDDFTDLTNKPPQAFYRLYFTP